MNHRWKYTRIYNVLGSLFSTQAQRKFSLVEQRLDRPEGK